MSSRLASLCSLTLLLTSVASAQVTEIPAKQAAAKAAPRDLAAQTALGVAYLRAGRFGDAAKQMERAEALAKGSPAAVMRQAEVAIAQGDYKRARGLCKKLFTDQGAPPLAHVCMARASLAWNRSELAFEEVEAALAQDPNSSEAQLVLGHANRIRNHVPEAEAAYARAREDRTLEAEADLGLGRLYAAVGRTADAVAALRAGLERDPEWPELQYELALQLGGSEEARELLKRALTGRPNWAQAALALGDSLLHGGDAAGAEAAYRKAVADEPALAAAHTGLGEALLAEGRSVEAEAALQKGLSMVANDARATLALAEIKAKKGELNEAVELFRKANDMDPRNLRGLLRAAELLIAEHQTTLAAGYLDRALKAQPENAQALELYGDLMQERGDKAAADGYYARAKSATP